MIDYEVKLSEIIQEYKAGEKHRWAAAFAINELWQAYPDRHGEIMAVLVVELNITDDAVYNLLHASELAGASDSTRKLAERLSPSHFSRLHRAAEKYKLDSGAVEEYLTLAAENNMSAQALIEEVAQAYDPDPLFLWHRVLRSAVRACRRLLEAAEYNGLGGKAREAARLLLDILEDMKGG